jgi:hypothetical protein
MIALLAMKASVPEGTLRIGQILTDLVGMLPKP